MTNLAYFLTCKWRVFHTLFYFEKSIITLQTRSFSSFDICLKRLSLWPIESRTLQFRSLKQCSLPLIIIATENRPVSCTFFWSSLKKKSVSMKLFAISLMFVACFCILIGLIQNVVNTDHGGIYPTDRNIIHLNGDDVNLWWFVQV